MFVCGVGFRRSSALSSAPVYVHSLPIVTRRSPRQLDWAVEKPVDRVRKPKSPPGRLRYLTYAQYEALRAAAALERQAEHLPDFVALAVFTGMRKGELLFLQWRQVDMDGRRVWLEAADTKTSEPRMVPLSDDALAALGSRGAFRDAHCPPSPWVFCHADGRRITDVKKSFRTACRRAGLEDFRVHDLRHTCAAWLVSSGRPLIEVRDMLGHTVRMTERYAHLAPGRLQEAAHALNHVGRKRPHLDLVGGGQERVGSEHPDRGEGETAVGKSHLSHTGDIQRRQKMT